jgi:hypothetical protein
MACCHGARCGAFPYPSVSMLTSTGCLLIQRHSPRPLEKWKWRETAGTEGAPIAPGMSSRCRGLVFLLYRSCLHCCRGWLSVGRDRFGIVMLESSACFWMTRWGCFMYGCESKPVWGQHTYCGIFEDMHAPLSVDMICFWRLCWHVLFVCVPVKHTPTHLAFTVDLDFMHTKNWTMHRILKT